VYGTNLQLFLFSLDFIKDYTQTHTHTHTWARSCEHAHVYTQWKT